MSAFLHLPARAGVARIVPVLLALVVALGGAQAVRAAEPPADGLTPEQKELEFLKDLLIGPDRTFSTRRAAAVSLLDKETPEAGEVLVEALSAPGEPALAALDALAARSTAPQTLIDPLFQLLRSEDEAARRSAAIAFGAYQDNDRVLADLKALATDAAAPQAARLAGIEALAQIVDRRSVAALVQATQDADPAIATSAALALSDMTGLRETSPEKWAAWWQRHENEPESVFMRGLLRRFRTELRQRDTSLEAVRARLASLLTEIYQVADPKEKARLIREHLDDLLPQVRTVAARQATPLARDVYASGANGTARQQYQDLIQALVKRIADESPQVRAAVAEALAAWQEQTAAPLLLARLDAEKAPEVRAAVAGALGSLKVVEAVPKLVAMLASAQPIEVIRAAGALGAIGERTAGAPGTPVEPALEPLSRLARSAADPSVREAAVWALAKIAPPSAEEVLTAALQDQAAGVRFSAAQALGNLQKLSDAAMQALTAGLQDENPGVRQAAAAALAKQDVASAAWALAERLRSGAEKDPTVRSALWTGIEGLVSRVDGADLAEKLGDWFIGLEGPEAMQRAASLYETTLAKLPPAANGGERARAVLDKLVDAYTAAGAPERAVPALRQLLETTPTDQVDRLRRLRRQLGLILVTRQPYVDGVALLAEAMEGADVADRTAILRAVLAQMEALVKADQPAKALEVATALREARPDLGGTELTSDFERVEAQAREVAAGKAASRVVNGEGDLDDGAVAEMRLLGRPCVAALLGTLETAAREGQASVESRALAALEAVTGRSDHGYDLTAPLEDRLAAIRQWRTSL